MDLMYLTNNIKQGQVAMVTFKGERWYIINSSGFIRYCDMNGENIGKVVKLTPSNILAHYMLIDDMSWIKNFIMR